MDMTLAQKQALQSLVEGGKKVISIAYDPNTVSGDPEAAPIAQGYIQFQRQVETNLIEVVYTK